MRELRACAPIDLFLGAGLCHIESYRASGDASAVAVPDARSTEAVLNDRRLSPTEAPVPQIGPASRDDLSAIQAAYEHGRATQRAQGSVFWPPFPDAAVIREIENGWLFCVRDDAEVVGVFSMLEDDAIIWGAAERGEHLYLHRIARAASYRGGGLVDTILRWAQRECGVRGRAGLRMDTWAGSGALIAYYSSRGFRLVGSVRLPSDPQLAPHYHGIELALLEAEHDSSSQ